MSKPIIVFADILNSDNPAAVAWVDGNSDYSSLNGIVKFYDTPYSGMLVEAEIYNLPDKEEYGNNGFYGFHIHENGICEKNFLSAGKHYGISDMIGTPAKGDMPMLFSKNGYAYMVFFDKNINVDEIIGKSVIIHSVPDSYTQQMPVNSGERIGCGIIEKREK